VGFDQVADLMDRVPLEEIELLLPGLEALRAELDAWEGDRRAYSQNWQRTIPRDGT